MSIEAMKMALEALEFIPESGSMLGAQAEAKRVHAITALCQAIEQAEQAQPVAWSGVDFDIKTAPPPRQPWIGLTDEEQQELYDAWIKIGDGWGSFYTLIEAKLKEKNT